jgi:hypothetical protein
MPSTGAPNWWADVQQEREDLAPAGRGRRPADDWLGEEIDFVPRRRLARADATVSSAADARQSSATDARDSSPTTGTPSVRRTALSPAAARAAALRESSAAAEATAAHPLHGVFVPAPHAPVSEAVSSMTIELTSDAPPTVTPASPADVAHELAHLSAADDPFATPPPPAGARRTVQIKGRPEAAARISSMAQRHRRRTASDRVGPRPDRIALWAVALGAILIILAAMTSSSQAAVPHRAAAPAAVTAKVSTIHTSQLRTAPLRSTDRQR